MTLNPLNETWRSDGVFPLSWDTWYDDEVHDSPPATILQAFKHEELTLLFGGDPAADFSPAAGGWMTFGGKDTDHCEDKWTWLQQGFQISRSYSEFMVAVNK
ncbi:hypothetical protein AAVH_25482 [Aphelenchoides avenae]|nr:hypothetical protein AAVH_36416 [Aphelenchus avenae]KAH7707293.1 hypothetical protein AAVH_25482 [Aphelenchus avenae]